MEDIPNRCHSERNSIPVGSIASNLSTARRSLMKTRYTLIRRHQSLIRRIPTQHLNYILLFQLRDDVCVRAKINSLFLASQIIQLSITVECHNVLIVHSKDTYTCSSENRSSETLSMTYHPRKVSPTLWNENRSSWTLFSRTRVLFIVFSTLNMYIQVNFYMHI